MDKVLLPLLLLAVAVRSPQQTCARPGLTQVADGTAPIACCTVGAVCPQALSTTVLPRPVQRWRG